MVYHFLIGNGQYVINQDTIMVITNSDDVQIDIVIVILREQLISNHHLIGNGFLLILVSILQIINVINVRLLLIY